MKSPSLEESQAIRRMVERPITEEVSTMTETDYVINPGKYYGSFGPGDITGSQAKVIEDKLAGSKLENVGLTDDIKNINQKPAFGLSKQEQVKLASNMLQGKPLEHASIFQPESDKWQNPAPVRPQPIRDSAGFMAKLKKLFE